MNKMNKLGQVSVFVIIAIVILAGVVAYFVINNGVSKTSIPANLEPVYNSFLNCLQEDVLVGVDVLESQGGYIEMPEFVPGSSYMPFSSLLDLFGNPVPYWYYVSGNNIQREQVPTKSEMESQLSDFVSKKIKDCVFDSYYSSGFEIVMGEPNAEIQINSDNLDVILNMNLEIYKADEKAILSSHKIQVNSELGKLYDSAIKVYNYEQKNLFLENYAVDTLRLYAPVDGVELTCSPKIWNADKVFEDLASAIETNTLSLRSKGGDFTLRNKANKYFVLDLGVSENVRFINSKNWPNSFDVAPTEEVVMISNPVGNQPGLGILGFCYVPYHFVYNMKYPVLIQVSSNSGKETFQFPMAVIIQGNLPRESGKIDTNVEVPREFCKDKNTLMQINIYDSALNSVDADISYSCFGEVCPIGGTENGVLEDYFPQCANGIVLAKAEGFADGKIMASSVQTGSVDLVLDRLYNQNIELTLDNRVYNGDAIISFSSDKVSKTVLYPNQKNVSLVEGQYDISVYIYKNSSIKISASVKKQCFKAPRSGLGGLFGMTEEKCVDLTIPEQIISNALSGGGTQKHYILESDLINSRTIAINADSLKAPQSLEDLQDNYILFDAQGLGVSFK